MKVHLKNATETVENLNTLVAVELANGPRRSLGVVVMKRALPWLLFVVAFIPSAYAVKHPVPFEKGVTDANCVECHENKTKGKNVHAAVQTGCQTCHFVRSTGDDSRVVLKNARVATLCQTCHADKNVATVIGRVHPPAKEDCTRCHDPHVSENDHLLKKAEAGDKDTNLCLSCHKQLISAPEKGSRHAALDMGCDSCHTTHKVGERGKPEFDFHLKATAPELCLTCHDAKDENLIKTHQGQPFATANCLSCHDPHQSAAPKLMQANLHVPFEGKMCDSCHAPAEQGKVKLINTDSRALCLTCHEEAGKKMEAAKVQHPGAMGECIACHNPHAGKNDKFVPATAACLSCHAEEAEMLKSAKVLHDPVFNQRCSICHDAHGNDRQHLLRADTDDLCLTCHAPDAAALKSKDGKTEAILNKTVLLPVGYVAKAPHIDLTHAMEGHPVPAHPIKGLDPRDHSKELSCVTCHNPHAGKARRRLNSADGSQRELCKQCHKEQQ